MAAYSILIVDDDEVDRYSLKRMLRAAGIDAYIHEEPDGQAALEFLADRDSGLEKHGELFPPLIVLLDINMPRMDGFKFLKEFARLRATDEFQTTVFLMVTSSDNESDKQRAKEFDFVKGYIQKMPDTPADLRSHLESYLPGGDVAE